jgi:hypothetical protein
MTTNKIKEAMLDDVLAVFETKDKRRLALHIENKLASGSFTPLLNPSKLRKALFSSNNY